MWVALTAFLAATAAPPAAPAPAPAPQEKPEYIRLDPGNAMTIADDGKFAVRPAPDLGPADREQLERVKAAGDEAMGSKSITTIQPAEKAGLVPDQLSFHLLNVGEETVLFIRNGLKDSVRYKLVIQTKNGLGPTDVCEVFSQRHATEHWPYKIQWAAIGEVERFEQVGDAPPVCK